jgi:hypothetical protein
MREYERDAQAGEDDPDQPVDDPLCPEHGRAQPGGGEKVRDGGEPGFFVVFFELLSMAFYLAIGGISPALRDISTVPNAGIHRSLRNSLLIGVPGGVVVGVITGYAFGVRLTLQFGFIDGLVAGGSVFVLTALHAGGRAWLHHFALPGALIINGQIPVRWVRFLHYATDNILLHRIGGGYAFTHRIFLEYFVRLHLSSADLTWDEVSPAHGMTNRHIK